MAFLRALRGNGEHPDPLQTEIRELANRIHDDRQSLEHLLTRAEGSSTALGKMTEPVVKMSERLAALERQVNAIEQRAPAVATMQAETEQFLKMHREIETRLGDSEESVARLTSQIAELGRLVEGATGLKRDLPRLLELEAPLRTLQGQAHELSARMTDVADSCGRLRERQEALGRTSADAASRLATIDAASQAATRRVEEHGRRVEELEQSIGHLTQLAEGASDAKHQVLMLKALADQVTQKVAALENQRDAVERVAKDVSRLDGLVQVVDSAIRQQESQIVHLHALATDVDDLRSMYESVAARSQEISAHQQQVEEQGAATRKQLADLGEQLRRAAERFDLEHRGLETVNHRITDLRAAVKDCEDRVGALDASSRAVTDLATKVQNIWTRVGFLMGDVAKLDEQGERMRVLRADIYGLHKLMQEMSARSAEIEKAKPAVDAVIRDLGAVSGTSEVIKEALGQTRMAQEEVARVREGQAGTETWLKTVQESVGDLRERVQQLDAARPTVESLQKDVERVLGAVEVVASRRQLMDDMQKRLAELASLGGQLDDRTKAFRSRLDIAEGRFVAVTKQAEEADRIATLVSGVARTVAHADSRIGELTRSIASLEGRSETLDRTAERVRLLGREVEQRQGALDKASEHLARASALRQEAADVVQQLEERTRAAQSALVGVEDRAQGLETLWAELDGRFGKLRSVEKGLAQFDDHLGAWEVAKLELQRSLEQIGGRQVTVDALQANLRQMFEMAERTANDVRAASEAQREIRESKGTLDDLLHRVRDADAATARLEVHKQEIENAERRLARAEALLIDIRSSLETMQNQKVMLDRVIEKTGALSFQLQQAETLIERLRKERDITSAVRSALEEPTSRSQTRRGGS